MVYWWERGVLGMRYKIGDVSRILGISADLLRYYEKKGVVRPQKDQNNDYRYYDTWDINFLIDCLWFKHFGFGIPQVAYMVTDCYHGDLISLLDEKSDQMASEIRKQEQLLARLREYREAVERVKAGLGVCDIQDSPELICYLNRFNYSYNYTPEMQRLSRQWQEYMPFTQRYFEIPQEGLMGDGADFAWGFSLRTPYAEELNVQVKPPVKRLPSRRCIHSAFRSAGKNAFTPRHLSFLLDFAKEQELKIAGNAMGTLVCSVREEGSDDLTGYFEVWLPVEDEAYEN